MVVNLPFWKPPPFLFHGFYKKNHDPLSHSGDQRALFSDLFCVHFWEPWGISVSSGDALLSPSAVRYLLSDWRDDGWQQGRASRTLLMRFKQGQVFYMQCAYLWLTACMSQCDPSHQTLARDMSQSTYHSDMNGWAPPLIPLLHRRGPPGLSVWTGTSGLSGTEEIHTRSHFTDLSHVTAVTGSSFFCLQFSDLHEFLDISVTLWAEGNISEASGGSKEDVIAELLRRRSLFIIENIKYTAVWHAGFSFFNTKPTIS